MPLRDKTVSRRRANSPPPQASRALSSPSSTARLAAASSFPSCANWACRLVSSEPAKRPTTLCPSTRKRLSIPSSIERAMPPEATEMKAASGGSAGAHTRDLAHDLEYMARVLDLAAKGRGLASPNPMVGAVLVRDGHVVAEAFHTYDGLRHAEIIALEAAGENARGATLYVNLEPCCHTGRTGPCTRTLISAGIARVAAAMRDPNPRVAGRGFQELRAAGIRVDGDADSNPESCPDSDPHLEKARRLNEAFAWWIRKRRPLVTLKTALTLDGSLG